MKTWLSTICIYFFCAGVALTQGFSGLARVDPTTTHIHETRGGGVEMQLGLSLGVPFRVFTLDAPNRLVMDFQEVDWAGFPAAGFHDLPAISHVQYGTYVPGLSRIVFELSKPLSVRQAAMQVDPVTAGAVLELKLEATSQEAFTQASGAPNDPRWDLPEPEALPQVAGANPDAPLLILLDPGHGGIDPGAQTEFEGREVNEKDVALQFALELGEILLRSGQFDVRLTRNDDYFVSLERRITLAHQADADLFLSLHADSLSAGYAHGVTIYTLSDEASDVASAKLAERQERNQLLSGTDLSDTDDVVADVLLDLARVETHPRSLSLAQSVADGMQAQGGPMNRRPLRSAGFSVLKSADIPSILIEIGFLSSPRDLKNIMDPSWRQRTAQGILEGLLAWQEEDAARKTLVRN